MEKVADFIKNNKFNLFIAVLYLIITVFTMFHHEIWRDEAQVWCIVRDCGFLETLQRIRLEGHPALWYLLVMPFAKLGLPVLSMQIVSLLIVFIAVLFLLFKSPFNKFEKIIISFSAGMLYFLPIIARNYALVPVFIFLLANIYPKRNEKPFLYAILLILLSNTHMLIEGFCLILFTLFGIEQLKVYLKDKNIKVLLPVLLIFLNFLMLFLMFHGVANDNHALSFYAQDYHVKTNLFKAIMTFSTVFFLFPLNSILISNPAIFHANSILITNPIIFYPVLFMALIGLFKLDKKVFIILSAGILYHFYIFYYVWFNGIKYQKAYILFLVIIFCYWVCYEKRNKLLTAAFCILFTINSIFSIFAVLFDAQYNFSSAKQTAEYIRENLNNEEVFRIEIFPFLFTPISAYLPDKKFYHYGLENYVTYHDFFVKNSHIEEPKCNYLIRDISDKDLPNPIGYTLVYKSDPQNIIFSYHNEAFEIYKKTSQ